MQSYIARPKFTLEQLDKITGEERFIIKVDSLNGSNDLPYDKFIISISDEVLSIWNNNPDTNTNLIFSEIAKLLIELHGNASKFNDNYFIDLNKINSSSSLNKFINYVNNERLLEKYIDTRKIS